MAEGDRISGWNKIAINAMPNDRINTTPIRCHNGNTERHSLDYRNWLCFSAKIGGIEEGRCRSEQSELFPPNKDAMQFDKILQIVLGNLPIELRRLLSVSLSHDVHLEAKPTLTQNTCDLDKIEYTLFFRYRAYEDEGMLSFRRVRQRRDANP